MTRAKIYKIGSVYSRVIRAAACDDSEYVSRALNIFRPYLTIADRYARTVQNFHKHLNKFTEENGKEIAKLQKELALVKDDPATTAELEAKIAAVEEAREVEETKTKQELREFEDELVDVVPFMDQKDFEKFIGEKKIYKLSAGDLYDLYVFDKHLSDDADEQK